MKKNQKNWSKREIARRQNKGKEPREKLIEKEEIRKNNNTLANIATTPLGQLDGDGVR